MKPSMLTILLVCGLLTSSAGCQCLGIPSYRADSGGEPLGNAGFDPQYDQYSPYDCADAPCPPGILPPPPGWLAKWKSRRDLPEPPPYPRFHPLPTRPMFSPKRGFAAHSASLGYGGLPPSDAWDAGQGNYQLVPAENLPEPVNF